MDRYGVVAIIFTISFILSTSNASVVFSLRKLIAASPSNDSTISQVSPVPSPISGGDNKRLKSSSISEENSGKEKHKDAKMDVNNNNDKGVAKASPPPVTIVKKSDDKKEKTDDSTKSQLKNDGSCQGLSNWCRDQKDMVACLEMFRNGSKTDFIVVQNKGEGSLRVNIHMLSSVDNASSVLEIPKHQSRRINISSTVHNSTKVILNAGSGECVLQLGRLVSVENFLQQLSFYSKQVPPMYGAYFAFLVAILLGGTWACCRLSKRRRHSGIPYQELEMGLPECASTANVDAAEDWDQDWDDDWDDDGAVKSTNGHHTGSISANGLTSRSSRKEGWEDDWGD